MRFVYVPFPEDVPVYGVSAQENLTAQQVSETVSGALNGGYRFVDIQNKEVLITESELAQFDALSLQERMMVMLAAMGLEDTDNVFRDALSEPARALAAAIDDRVEKMTESERKRRNNDINRCFSPREVQSGNETCESAGIVLIIEDNGRRSYERYCFYYVDGCWRLYQIEEGRYIAAD